MDIREDLESPSTNILLDKKMTEMSSEEEDDEK